MIRQDPYAQQFAAKQAEAKQAGLLRRQQGSLTAFANYMEMWKSSGIPIQAFVYNSQDAFVEITRGMGLSPEGAIGLMQSFRDKPVSVQDIAFAGRDLIAREQVATGGLPGDSRGQGGDPLLAVQGAPDPNARAYNYWVPPEENTELRAQKEAQLRNEALMEQQIAAAEQRYPQDLKNFSQNEALPQFTSAPPEGGAEDLIEDYGQRTGDVHRPALIGDREAVVNKEGVKALEHIFGPDFFSKLQSMFPNKDADSIPDYPQMGPGQGRGLDGGYPVPAFPEGRTPQALGQIAEDFSGSSRAAYGPEEIKTILGLNAEIGAFPKRQQLLKQLDDVAKEFPRYRLNEEGIQGLARSFGLDEATVLSRLKGSRNTAQEGIGLALRNTFPDATEAGLAKALANTTDDAMRRGGLRRAGQDIAGFAMSKNAKRAVAALAPFLGTAGKLMASELGGGLFDLVQGTPANAPGGLSGGEMAESSAMRDRMSQNDFTLSPANSSSRPNLDYGLTDREIRIRDRQEDRRLNKLERSGEFDLVPAYYDGKDPRAEAYGQYGRLRQADKTYDEQVIRADLIRNGIDPDKYAGMENLGQRQDIEDPRVAERELERNAQLTPTGADWERIPARLLSEEPGVWEVNTAVDQTTLRGDGFVIARRKSPTTPYSPAPATDGRPYVQSGPEAGSTEMKDIRTGDIIPAESVGSMDQDLRSKNLGLEVQGAPEIAPIGPEDPEEGREQEEGEPEGTPETPKLFKRADKPEEGFWAGIFPGIEKAYADIARSSPGMAQLMGLDNFVSMYNADILPKDPDLMKQQLDYMKFLHDQKIDFANLELDEFKALDTQEYRRAQAANAAAGVVTDRMGLDADMTQDEAQNLFDKVEMYTKPLLQMQADAIAGESLNLAGLDAISEQLGPDINVEPWYVPNDDKSWIFGRRAAGGGLSQADFDALPQRNKKTYTGMILLDGRILGAPGGGSSNQPREDLPRNAFDVPEYNQ